MKIYSGSNPNTGTLLGSSTAFVGHSQGVTDFAFNVLVPQTVTYTVSVTSTLGIFPAYQGVQNTNVAPQLGSAPNSLW